jgi:amino acid transporter
MGPVLAVILNAPAAASSTGGALPFAFLLSMVIAFFTGATLIQFTRRLPSSGSFYTFTSRGLGSSAGFFTGWLFFGAYAALSSGLFGAVGFFAQSYVQSTFNVNLPWWVFGLFFTALVFTLAFRSVRSSVRVDLSLLTVEVTVFLILATIAIVKAGSGNSAVYFSPGESHHGLSGVGLGVVFGILSFVGFDAAATLGEESRNPKRLIPLAVGGSLLLVGIFYVYVMYGLAAGYHLNSASGLKAFVTDGTPFVTLAHRYAPWLVQMVDLCAVAGLFSAYLALQNTTIRVLFSMGREGALPHFLGGVHPRFHSPHHAIYALTTFTVISALPIGIWLGPGPAGLYGFTGAIGTVGIVIVYIMCNVALVRFFFHHPDFNPIYHVLFPVLGIIGLLYPLWSTAAPGQAFPYDLVPYIVLVYILAGIAVYLRIRATPGKLEAFGSVVAGEPITRADEGGILEPALDSPTA